MAYLQAFWKKIWISCKMWSKGSFVMEAIYTTESDEKIEVSSFCEFYI